MSFSVFIARRLTYLGIGSALMLWLRNRTRILVRFFVFCRSSALGLGHLNNLPLRLRKVYLVGTVIEFVFAPVLLPQHPGGDIEGYLPHNTRRWS